ncbi:MAG: Xaa-Pro peptidase family protein [Gluconacetobacter liquefaciens]
MGRQIGFSTLAEQLASVQPLAQDRPGIPDGDYAVRLGKAVELCAARDIDALVIGAGSSLRYFSGVPWKASERPVLLVLRAGAEPVMLCPAFERGSLLDCLRIPCALALWEEHEDPCAVLADLLHGRKRVALDPELPFRIAGAVAALVGGAAFESAAPVIDALRMVKSAAEIAVLRYAMTLTLQVHRHVAAAMRPGVRASEVRSFIDQAHRRMGADNGASFAAVQFGQATAFPHGIAGDQILRDDELVLVDCGCQIHGYHADITRTYVCGMPGSRQREIWDIERRAQQVVFDAVKPGVPCGALDDAVRGFLADSGLGPGYHLPGLPHRTGHGIGLDIHEAPYIMGGDRRPIEVGMCFSDEPMIVVPDIFGVRLEDHIHVSEAGPCWFSQPAVSITQPFDEK